MTNHADLDVAGSFNTALMPSGPVDTVPTVVPGFLGDLGVVKGDIPPAVHTAGSRVCGYGLAHTIL